MKLQDYLHAGRGRATTLARQLGISASRLSQISSDSSRTSPAICVKIEIHTGGVVSRRDLRPDWRDIWPELDRRRAAKLEASRVPTPAPV